MNTIADKREKTKKRGWKGMEEREQLRKSEGSQTSSTARPRPRSFVEREKFKF